MATANNDRGRKSVRKLTLRSFGTLQEMRRYAESGQGKEMEVCRIIGRVIDAKVGNSDNGEFIKLMGTFQGLSLFDGTLAQGEYTDPCGVAILPNYLANTIMSALADGGTNIEFHVKFCIKEYPTSAVGYVFEAYNMLPVKANPQLETLWGDFAPVAALPAPTGTPAALTNDTASAAKPKAPAPAPAKKGTVKRR